MHKPVLLHEAVEALGLSEGKVFLDGTLGSGGHSAEVATLYGEKVTIIGLDRDQDALRRSGEKLRNLHAKHFLKLKSFREMDEALEEVGVSSVDAILLDLGISSNQIEESGRGFTFQKDEPLLMTMKENPGEEDLTARKILNTFSEETLELIIRGFGEEKYSRKIARAIVERREEKPFETTSDLVETIMGAVPAFYERGRINPATRTFQALRIATNEELTALEEGLAKGFEALSPGGRFAVISFHSLEDRIVKNFFRDKAREGKAKLINKKPITASEEEIRSNPRSRSAKLRIIEKMSKTKAISYDTRANIFWFLLGASVLFLFVYFYAINSIAHTTAVRQNLEAQIADAAGKVGGLEFAYIEMKNSITSEVATSYGYKEAKKPLYVSRSSSAGVLTFNR